MGRLTNQLIGTAHGRIGNLVTRARKKGESIVYPYNPKRKKVSSQKAVAHNNRFKIINKFSSAVNDSALLKRIWNSNRKLKGRSPYTRIHSFNYQFSCSDFMTKSANIVPSGIYCNLTKFTANDDEITVTIIPDGNLINSFNLPCVAICIMNLNTPEVKQKGKVVFDNDIYLSVEQEFISLKLVAGKPVDIKFRKFPNEFRILNDYRRVRVFFTLVFNSSENKLICSKSPSYLYKGAELDREYDELNALRNEEEKLKNNITGEPYFSFTRR